MWEETSDKEMFAEMRAIAEGNSENLSWFANFCEPGEEGGIIIALSPFMMSNQLVSDLVQRLKEEIEYQSQEYDDEEDDDEEGEEDEK